MIVAAKTHTEVYRFRPWLIPAAVALAVYLQTTLPRYLGFHPLLALFDLALLVVVYFGISRRNPSTGLLLGLAVGVIQDVLSFQYIGLYGMAKTLVGFVASSLSGRIDTDRPHSRLILVFLFYYLHQFTYALVQRLLLAEAADFFSLRVLEGALVNALAGVLVFLLLDRFRQST